MTETTERFLREIAARLGGDRVAELHLFPVIRQSGVESAVAVVAAQQHRTDDAAVEHAEDEESAPEHAVTSDDLVPDTTTRNAGRDAERGRTRHVVYTARYRHTVKGTERGKWIFDMVAEADAPLLTVEQVVRGVVQRSGEAFQPERISGDQLRAIVPAQAAPEPAQA